MERLTSNINKLISRHNCVILPGMGAFLAHNVSATYNAEDQVFMPPHRTLGFNPQVNVDDALLLSEYLKDSSLTYEEACTALDNDIATLRSRLSRKGVYRFGELGTFSMDINSGISFEPNANGIDDPYNFGFEPIAIPLLSECGKRDIVIRRRDLNRYVAVVAAIIIAFFFVTPISDSAYEPGMQATITGITPGKTAPTAIMLEAPIAKPQESICEIAPVTDTATENIITVKEDAKETVPAETAIANESETKKGLQATATPSESPVATKAANKAMFHIIVASTPSAKNAQLAIKELSYKMETDYEVVKADRRYRISAGIYESEQDAEKALQQIKKTFPDAWIFARK